MKTIIAENKRTGETVEFTFEAWTNLKNTGHSGYWRIIDTSALIPEKITPVVFSSEDAKELVLAPNPLLIDWREKLIDENIPFNKSIKNTEKLKEIYENYHKENPVVNIILDAF